MSALTGVLFPLNESVHHTMQDDGCMLKVAAHQLVLLKVQQLVLPWVRRLVLLMVRQSEAQLGLLLARIRSLTAITRVFLPLSE
jgi:hypothetical protein